VQVLVVLALTLVAVALAAPELNVHAVLRATRPADGAGLERAPDALVLEFIPLGALLVLVGGLAFLLLVWPDGLGAPRARRLIAGTWTAAVTAVLAGVLLHRVATCGGPPAAVRTFIPQPRRLGDNG
jgi:hypothetical protein